MLFQVTQQEITDYCRMFEQKIASFLQPASKIADDEYSKLGAKEADSYPSYLCFEHYVPLINSPHFLSNLIFFSGFCKI